MGTYNLPRNVKGEGRILFVFSTKALIYTFVGVVIGLPFYFIFNMMNITFVGFIIIGIFGLLGFLVATFKMPDTNAFEITKNTGGENIDDVVKRWFIFKRQKNKIYVYQEDKNLETKDGGVSDE